MLSSLIFLLGPAALLLLLLLLLLPLAQLSMASPIAADTQCSALQELSGGLAELDAMIVRSLYVGVGELDVGPNETPFCRVWARRSYGQNDTLEFEVWLPDPGEWDGRFVAIGNGGMAGTIDHSALLRYLPTHSALAATNAGHSASSNNNGTGAPSIYLPYLHSRAQLEAWIHDSIALATPPARALTTAYFNNKAPHHSYFVGCSTGGAQGFALAQRWPALFDGIYAGCPGFAYARLALSFLHNAQATRGEAYLSLDTLKWVKEKVLEQCDGLDGLRDRVLENPFKCPFDIGALACGVAANASRCLSPQQVAAARAVYAGPSVLGTNSSSSNNHSSISSSSATNTTMPEQVYPGFAPGSEAEWASGQEGSLANEFSLPLLQNLVFDDLDYDALGRFQWSADEIGQVDEQAGTWISAESVALEPFYRGGGKMIVVQGWADPYNAPTAPINYLSRLQTANPHLNISDFFAVFMVPGGGHCNPASSYPSLPAQHAVLPALHAWVEAGVAPAWLLSSTDERVLSAAAAWDQGQSSGQKARSRRLCPWPMRGTVVDGGDATTWRDWRCV